MSGYNLETLSNNKSGELGWEDPTTKEPIPRVTIRSPKILYLMNVAFDVKNVLKYAFKHSLVNGKIWYSFLNKYMDANEQQKFVRDISALFCISQEKFLDCWNVEITIATIPAGVTLDDLQTLARVMKFLELIPPQAITENLASLLSNEQRALINQLTLAPESQAYCEVIGNRAFYIQKYLDLTIKI